MFFVLFFFNFNFGIGEIADLKACVQMDCHERKKAVLMECVKKAIGSCVEKGIQFVYLMHLITFTKENCLCMTTYSI